MKKYIGTKMVMAEPAFRLTGRDGHQHIVAECPVCLEGEVVESGYRVLYEDGYQSWSPKEVFEKAYRETSGLSFGLTIEAVRMGYAIARRGWNGKRQYVELADGISYRNSKGNIVNVNHDSIGNKAFAFVGTSGVQLGWLASQADMLADDWYILER